MKRIIFSGLFLILIFTGLNGQTIVAYGDLDYEDTIDFSSPNNWITINNPDINIWEIGKPNKLYFNSAYNGVKVILTDSTNFYSDSCNDYFYMSIPWLENHWGEGILSFYHKFDTDTLVDGGVIEVSYDNGNSWINYLDDSHHMANQFIGLYEDTIRGGAYGFSGKSNGWQYVELYWFWIGLTKTTTLDYDNTIIRFRFLSDENNTNKEGWMIDDIVFRGYFITGAIDITSKIQMKVFPVPSNGIINIDANNEKSMKLNFAIYELSGKLIKRYQIINNQVNISDINSGEYIYSIFVDKKILSSGKLIKN